MPPYSLRKVSLFSRINSFEYHTPLSELDGSDTGSRAYVKNNGNYLQNSWTCHSYNSFWLSLNRGNVIGTNLVP